MSSRLQRRGKLIRGLGGRSIAWPRTGSPAAWAISVVLVLAGLVAKPLIEGWFGEQLPPFITMYTSVVISDLIGGPQIGVITALVTALLTWFFFLSPHFSFAIVYSRTVVSLFLYLAFSSLQGWIVGKARLALDALAESEAQRDRAARESVHRIKNLIAVVQAIIAKLAREAENTADYRSLLSNRLVALGKAQDVLVQSSWSDVDLTHIIHSALAPFLPNPGLQIRQGPPVLVPAHHVSGLNMALYELCTNSLKYGALAGGHGPVELSWSVDGDFVALEWREETPEPAERSEGLGTQLIRYALGTEAGCRVDYVINGKRVDAVFRWPAPHADLSQSRSHASPKRFSRPADAGF